MNCIERLRLTMENGLKSPVFGNKKDEVGFS